MPCTVQFVGKYPQIIRKNTELLKRWNRLPLMIAVPHLWLAVQLVGQQAMN